MNEKTMSLSLSETAAVLIGFTLGFLLILALFAQEEAPQGPPHVGEPPKPTTEWVVIFRIQDESTGGWQPPRGVVQGEKPILELRTRLRADSEGDATAKALLVWQRYMAQTDWDKVKFIESQKQDPKEKK